VLQHLDLADNSLHYPPDLIYSADGSVALIAWLRTPTPVPPYRVGWIVPFVLLLMCALLLLIVRAGVRRLHRWAGMIES
jgi:hypothetical protein